MDISPKEIYRWQTGLWKMSASYVIRRKQIKTIMRYHHTSNRMARDRTLTTNVEMGNNRTPHFLLVVIQDGKVTLKVVSHKTKHTFSMCSSNCTPCYWPQKAENFCPHKTLHINVYSSFICNCPNLEATKMSFSRWMDK